MMDRDYPPTPTQWKLTVVALGVCGVVGLLLFGGVIPGLHPNLASSRFLSLDGRTYYWTMLLLPLPWPGSERTIPAPESFHNVTFWTWFTNWTVLGGGYLHGNATELNGTVYPFALGGFRTQANWTDEYIAPGGAAGIEWDGSPVAYLLVLI
ncbi:MAG: hypothetical protein ACLQD8_00170 [Thermoplasmata archaeon]